MENHETPSNQPSPNQARPVNQQRPVDPVPVNSPVYADPVNKPNPNMVMAIALLFMLIIGLGFAVLYKGDKGTTELVPVDVNQAEKDRLKDQIASQRALTGTDNRANEAALETRISNILDNTHALQSEFNMMQAGYAQAMQDLQTAASKEQGYVNTIARIGSENAALKAEITNLRALASNAQSLQQQVERLTQELNNLRGRPTNESLSAIQQRLNNEQITNGELSRKVSELEARLRNMVDASELSLQSQRLADLTKENEDLRRQLQALQTDADFAKLFVTSTDTLPKHARALYSELKSLEGSSSSGLDQAYARIATNLNAQNLQQIRFSSGSSALNFTDQTMVKNKVETTSPGDYFLVVGYASKTGDATSNQKLSARRATAVASIVNQLKRSGQEVRAVYLGQTDRFSKSINAENQLCEVWRIRK